MGSGPLFCTSSCFLYPSSSLCYTSCWGASFPHLLMFRWSRKEGHLKCPSWRHGMQPRWENLLAGWPNMKLQPIWQIHRNILIYPSLHHFSHFGCMLPNENVNPIPIRKIYFRWEANHIYSHSEWYCHFDSFKIFHSEVSRSDMAFFLICSVFMRYPLVAAWPQERISILGGHPCYLRPGELYRPSTRSIMKPRSSI